MPRPIPRTLILLLLFAALPLFGDPKSAVENGLLPAVPIEGEAGMKLEERMRHYGVPGVSIAVWKDGRVEWAAGYGVAAPGSAEPVTTRTLFQAGSISKTLAAVTTLRVLSDLNIPLDADVNRYLGDAKLPVEGVTFERILSHTAGFNVPGFPGFAKGEMLPGVDEELQGLGNTQPLRVDGKPGTEFHYSGGGYLLLQKLLETLTRRSINSVLGTHSIVAARLTSSTFVQSLPQFWANRKAGGLTEEGEPVAGGSHIYPEKTAAGLWTLPTDMARFLAALQTNKLLPRELTERMLSPAPGTNGRAGLGVFLIQRGKSRYFTHSGGNTGFSASYVASRARPEGVVVMANAENADPLIEEIVRAVAKVYGWPDYAPAPRRLAKVDPESFTGRYAFDADDLLAVRAVNGQVIVARTAGEEKRLDALTPTELVNREDGETYVFGKDSVTVGGVTAKRTREAPPSDLITRDVDTGIAYFRGLDTTLLTEERLRMRGVSLRKRGNLPAALALLKLNAEMHPASAAAHDALATTQLAAGDAAGARVSSQKVLDTLAADWTPTASWRQVYRRRAKERLRERPAG
jgi:CubicO group peptidase (beta-lactamase class C family)